MGQGLPIAVGIALGLRHQKNPAFVYNSMSDGELDEGSTWEAAMGAAHHRLGNLICLVDINNQFHAGTPLAFSVGVAISRPGERLEAALHRADKQMYQQKKAYYEGLPHDRRGQDATPG